ncbi:MAG TPA: SatD family protein [Mucilaginibacter sp.]
MKEYVILMADVIGSRGADQAELMLAFKKVVDQANGTLDFVSPLTITLGDEFQGVVNTVGEGVQAVVWLEEAVARQNLDFKLRYVAVEGLIETPVNKKIAYGMLGDGLTRARKYLENLKKEESRFFFWLKDSQRSIALNGAFTALQEIIDDWNTGRDYYLIDAFLTYDNYARVAMELKKERSLMWKRRKSLKINAYLALKGVANYIAHA